MMDEQVRVRGDSPGMSGWRVPAVCTTQGGLPGLLDLSVSHLSQASGNT